MALKKSLILFPMLALMLLVIGWVHPSQGQETLAMRFRRQHIDSNAPFLTKSTYCNVMMMCRNMTQSSCKNVNTFVHASNAVVDAVCHEQIKPCRNGTFKVCHKSNSPLELTNCVRRKSFPYPNCVYLTKQYVKHIVIVCEGNPYLPVHFDHFV